MYNKPNITALISKTNILHSKIIELLVEKIDTLSRKERDQMKHKMVAVDLANTFVDSLSKNRDIDELLYDDYIKTIGESLRIFTYQEDGSITSR